MIRPVLPSTIRPCLCNKTMTAPAPLTNGRPCSCNRIAFAPDSPLYCRKCWKWYHDPNYRAYHEGRLIRINHGAGGLGDTLQGLVAIGGLRLDHPHAYILYRIHSANKSFIQLFDGGYDELGEHNHDHCQDDFEDGDIQLNRGWNHECRTKSEEPRWLRYARNIGTKNIVLPKLRDHQGLLRKGLPYRGSVLLAPFSTDSTRNWPVRHWLVLDQQLRERGHRVIIVDNDESRCLAFHAERMLSQGAERLVSTFLNASILVGNDSGLAHLMAILGKTTLVLCGPSGGEKTFGCYPDCHYSEGHLGCSFCRWQHPYNPRDCHPLCPNLASLSPQEVVTRVEELL